MFKPAGTRKSSDWAVACEPSSTCPLGADPRAYIFGPCGSRAEDCSCGDKTVQRLSRGPHCIRPACQHSATRRDSVPVGAHFKRRKGPVRGTHRSAGNIADASQVLRKSPRKRTTKILAQRQIASSLCVERTGAPHSSSATQRADALAVTSVLMPDATAALSYSHRITPASNVARLFAACNGKRPSADACDRSLFASQVQKFFARRRAHHSCARSAPVGPR